MRKICLLTFFVLCSLIHLSCKCGWQGNFLRVGPHQDLVLKAKVVRLYKVHSDIYEKMEVEVIKVLKGKETRKRIMV